MDRDGCLWRPFYFGVTQKKARTSDAGKREYQYLEKYRGKHSEALLRRCDAGQHFECGSFWQTVCRIVIRLSYRRSWNDREMFRNIAVP